MTDTAACRIIVVSSTTAQAQQFVQRVKAISSSQQPPPEPDDAAALTNTSDACSSSIPWTIVNKYYMADVHFETRECETFAGYHASDVPAVIYVWRRGDPYQEHVPALAEKLQHHGPEVSLAVRMGSAAGAQPYAKDEEEALDEFLSSHGFEYVDGDRAGRRPTRDGEGFSDEDSSGAAGLPRVIDALSTIMWPSLVQSAAVSGRKSRARELLDWAREEEADDGLRALVSHDERDAGPSTGAGPKKSRMQREMDELERWLEEEDAGRRGMDDAEAWGARSTGDTDEGASWSDVPTPLVRTPGGDVHLGFEDDFAEFVGAPVDVSYDGDGGGAARQRPMHTGASYRSLASGSEYGGEDVFGEEGDPDLPTRTEIEETSRRIFGDALGVPSGVRVRHRSAAAKSPEAVPGSSASPSPADHEEEHADIPYHPLDDDSFSVDGDEDDDFELGAFDLSKVLGALQGMKEEIAGMQDEDERRKAAARVALGLVYGLQKENGQEREAEST